MSQPSSSYPRSLPYQPARQPPARNANLWRWTLLLIGSSAVTAAVLIGAAVILLNRPSRPSEPRPAAAPRTWVRDLTPAVAARETPPPPPAPTPSPEPKPVEPAPDAAKQSERLLEALGGMTAAHLYQTYLNIGLLADSAESEVYTTAEARKLLETLTSLLNVVDRQLARVGEQDLKPEDQKSLQRTRQLVALLRTQSAELNAYWNTGDKEHTLKFHKAREDAWIGIKELLAIPE